MTKSIISVIMLMMLAVDASHARTVRISNDSPGKQFDGIGIVNGGRSHFRIA